MPVDTSIYANAVPQQPNPLAMAGQVASFQNAQNQNRLFNQEFAARQAVGQAYQGALDPSTGQIDVNKLVSNVANNPAAAFKAGEVGQQALAQQQGQVALSTAQLDNAHKQMQVVYDQLGALAGNPNLTPKDFIQAGGNLIAQKVSDPAHVVQVLQNMPPNATPQQLQAYAKQLQLQAMDSQSRIQAMYGSISPVGTGDATHLIQSSPFLGAARDIGTIQNKLSPGENAARIPTMIGGVPGSVPQSSITDPTGHAMGGQPATSGTSPLGTGRYPAQATTGASGAAAAGTPAGFVASGPKLGVGAAADVAASGSAKSYQDLHDTVANSGTRLYQLQQGLQALQGANTGKGSQTPQDIQSYIQTLAPDIAKSLGVDPQKIANYDEATKYLTGYAQTQAGSFGSHTDSQLATALTANPSTHISNLAATDVVKANIGLERMKQAQAQAFDESGLPPEEFNKWQVQWNKDVDPRAYMVDQLSPDKYKAMVGAMKPAEKSAFYQNLNQAIASGFATLPGQPNAR